MLRLLIFIYNNIKAFSPFKSTCYPSCTCEWLSCIWRNSNLPNEQWDSLGLWGLDILIRVSQRVLSYWGRDKMANIFQKTFSNAFSWTKNVNFMPQCQIHNIRHCVRLWLGTDKTTGYYLTNGDLFTDTNICFNFFSFFDYLSCENTANDNNDDNNNNQCHD